MITSTIGHYPRIGDSPEQQRLRRAIQAHQAQKLSDAELKAVQDDVTAEVLGEQVAAGLDQVTDGQIRWDDQATYLCHRMAGFERGGMIRYFDTNTYYRQPVAVAPVRWTAPLLVDDWRQAQALSARPVRALLTGPLTLAHLCADRHYDDRVAFTLDLAEALRQEVRALATAGVPVIQIDEPALTWHPGDEPLLSRALARVWDGVSGVTRVVALYHGPQAALVERTTTWPVDVVHFDCVTDPKVIDRLAVDGHPKGVSLGLVNARNTRLETVDELVAAVGRVATTVPVERLQLAPSCGLEFLPRDRARNKLARLVEAARAVAGGAR
jgi:5-methyltetrahydropteroyltriglutamate--homocysteine methyltransferase